jgi:predicted DNA-binding protein
MPKKIISLALSQETIEKIDKTSKALGMSRSELMEFLIQKGFHFSDDIEATVNKISKLQDETKEKIKKRRR